MNIEKKYHFYAAHRNKAGGEKCGRINDNHATELRIQGYYEAKQNNWI